MAVDLTRTPGAWARTFGQLALGVALVGACSSSHTTTLQPVDGSGSGGGPTSGGAANVGGTGADAGTSGGGGAGGSTDGTAGSQAGPDAGPGASGTGGSADAALDADAAIFAVGRPCTSDGDCADIPVSGAYCRLGRCSWECSVQADCCPYTTEPCGACVPGPATGPGVTVCMATCDTAMDCDDDDSCVGNVCIDPRDQM